MFTKNKATISFVIINIIVYFIIHLSIFGEISNANLSSTSLVKVGGLYAPSIERGEWYRLLTAMFIHGSFTHLLSNMLSMFALGCCLENMLGSRKYTAVFVGGGLIGNIAVFIKYHYMYYVKGLSFVMTGSSVCIFAVIGAMLVISILKVEQVGRISVLSMFIGTMMMLLPGITETETSFTGHIGGLLGGIFIGFLIALTIKKEEQYAGEN